MGAIRIQGNQENKEMEGPPWKKLCDQERVAETGPLLTHKWSTAQGTRLYNPRPFRTSCSIYCSQKTISSATQVTPWIVWVPDANSFLSVPSLWVQGSLPNRTWNLRKSWGLFPLVKTEGGVCTASTVSSRSQKTWASQFSCMTRTISLSS